MPSFFSIWDSYNLRIYPRPDKAYAYTLWGIGLPTEITNTTADVVGPPNYVQAVQNYAIALLFEYTRPELADTYIQMAEEQIVKFKKHLRNFQSHNIRRLRPVAYSEGGNMAQGVGVISEGIFSLNQSGVIRQMPVYYPLEA